jgi:hypothetical protein
MPTRWAIGPGLASTPEPGPTHIQAAGRRATWEYIDTEGDEAWVSATAPEQKAMTTIGLLEWARGVARYEQHRYLNAIADE